MSCRVLGAAETLILAGVMLSVGWLMAMTGLWRCSDLRVIGSWSLAASPDLDGFVHALFSFCPRITGKPIWSVDWISFLASVDRICFFQSGTTGLCWSDVFFL